MDGLHFANSIAVQPMEGCDGTAEGAPDELTLRRYQRFAKGGAAMIWEEATAVRSEGRANPRQLAITPKTLDGMKRMVEMIKELCMKENGFMPVVICQLTHSGRYSKPEGKPAPMIAYHNPIFEANQPIPDSAIVTDSYLDGLADTFGEAARLAQAAGFDGADIKCCHRYLLSELNSAYERPGRYGGSLENRTRLYRTAIKNAMEATGGGFVVTSRINLYDGFPYPNGFGVNPDSGLTPDLTESLWLLGQLVDMGVELVDITIGNPYVNPHVNRPYDQGGYIPPEHPLEGVNRMFTCIDAAKKAYPRLSIISSGHSYGRQFAPHMAAGFLAQGSADMAGFGRMSFAYPNFARDILNGTFDGKKTCIACGKCSLLMRAGTVAGCPVRDSECYMPYFQKYVMNK